VSVAMILLLVGSVQGGWVQIALYSTAVLIDVLGSFLGGGAGWSVNPGHFAERHGLIVIIALGESIVAIGAGASELPLSPEIALTAVLGLTIAACLWWVYFDITALAAERNLAALTGTDRNRAARDGYSILHWPMIAGIVLLALGVKKTASLVGSESFDLADHVKPLAAISLAAGVALYLLGHLVFRLRLDHSWSRPRAAAAAVCLVLAVVAPVVPTLALLVAVTVVVVVLVNYEYRRMGWLSYRLRHQAADQGAAAHDS
jgi:low temperature requirement protein LtrA